MNDLTFLIFVFKENKGKSSKPRQTKESNDIMFVLLNALIPLPHSTVSQYSQVFDTRSACLGFWPGFLALEKAALG